MSTPENPFGGSEPLPVAESDSRPAVPDNVTDAGLLPSFPAWTLADVLRVLVVLFLAMLFTGVLSVMLATMLPAFRNAKSAQIATDPRIMVPAQAFAYLVTIGFVYRMIAFHYRVRFWEGVHWRWPKNWAAYLAGGAALSVLLQLASRVLPIPDKMPIDDLFKTTSGVWLMALFGTMIAPFAEELFFRGLLYPALARRMGIGLAVAFTSLTFALIHASQLGWSLAAVSILVAVGLALTLVRVISGSLAASVIVHVGYNGFLFGLIFIGTHGFRKL